MTIHYSTHPQVETQQPTLEECLRPWFSQIPAGTYMSDLPHSVAIYWFRDGVRVGATVIRRSEYLSLSGHWEAI